MEYVNVMTYGENRKETTLRTSFVLTKKIRFKNDDELKYMVDKLDRLKNENFNRVLLPNFKYHVRDNFLIYEVDFIKGYPVGTCTQPFSQIVIEDVIERDSDWTFTDYHMTNFIVETKTNKLYAVDFQSYGFIPNKDLRREIWYNCQNTHKKIFQGLSNNEWIKPSIDYTH
tara:strand:+ start:5364 stop:5876 length:513 start_codon:yes stop_codon:yes gene_type:complete